MSVLNGQDANQTTFNNAFMSRTSNTSTTGKVDLSNADHSSVSDIQRELNAIARYTGKTINTAATTAPAWTSNDIGASGDSLFARLDALLELFPLDLGTWVDGILPIENGGTAKSTVEVGQVFWGEFEQSSAFFWDAANEYLGVGTSAPSGTLDIDGSFCLTSDNASVNASGVLAYAGNSENSFIRITAAAGSELYTIAAPEGNGDQVKILANVSGSDIDVTGDDNIETDGQTITFSDTTLILLVWDRVSSTWRILAGGGSSSVVITNFSQNMLGESNIECVGAQEQIWRFTAEAPEDSGVITSIDFSLVPQGGKVTFTSQSDSAYSITILDDISNVIMNGEWIGTQYSTIVFQRIGPRLIEVCRNGI